MAIRKDSNGGWLADFTVGTQRFRLKAASKALVQERMAETYAKLGQKISRSKGVRYSKDAYCLRQAIRNTHDLRWKHKACCRNAMGYAKSVLTYLEKIDQLLQLNSHDERVFPGEREQAFNCELQSNNCSLHD